MESVVLTYEECTVGMNREITVKITEDMIDLFQKVTEDYNPLHTNDEYAKQQGFDGKVVYGMLTASFLSTLVGMYLPGKYCIIHEINLKFPKPVYIGQRITFYTEIIEKNEIGHQLVLKVMATNEQQIKVLRGKMKVGVLDEVK